MNVSEAVSNQGVNALEGNITLNGSAVKVWIDGRPSNLSGKEIETLLSGTDGSTIDKIELISHISSRYDTSGSGGIINIKTKINFSQRHLNSTFILPKNYKFEVIGNYRTSVPFGRFVMQPSGGISAGLKKGVFENKGNLTITANDIFKTEGQNGTINEGRNKFYEINGYSNSQKIIITYSHSFGQSKTEKSSQP